MNASQLFECREGVGKMITDDPWLFLAGALILSVVVYVVSLGLTEVIFRLWRRIRICKGK